MTRFIVTVQEETKGQDIGKTKAGYVGEVIPPELVKDGNPMDDLQTTLALLKHCDSDSFRTLRLSNAQKSNPHGEKVIQAILAQCSAEDKNYEPLE